MQDADLEASLIFVFRPIGRMRVAGQGCITGSFFDRKDICAYMYVSGDMTYVNICAVGKIIHSNIHSLTAYTCLRPALLGKGPNLFAIYFPFLTQWYRLLYGYMYLGA